MSLTCQVRCTKYESAYKLSRQWSIISYTCIWLYDMIIGYDFIYFWSISSIIHKKKWVTERELLLQPISHLCDVVMVTTVNLKSDVSLCNSVDKTIKCNQIAKLWPWIVSMKNKSLWYLCIPWYCAINCCNDDWYNELCDSWSTAQ